MVSNVKSAPDALTPAKIEKLLGWMDTRKADRAAVALPAKRIKNG